MLYLVTDRSLSLGRSLVEIVQSAAQGGVTMVQLREKEITSREFVELGRAVHSVLQPFGIPLIINDRADIAMIIGAQGLHIGQSDILYQDARALMGAQAIIGLSVENTEQTLQCVDWGLDYIAVSPVFGTPTKCDTAPELGLDGLRRIKQMARCPVVAIGGINRSNIAQVVRSGADSVAVVSAICSAEDPRKAARELLSLCQIG